MNEDIREVYKFIVITGPGGNKIEEAKKSYNKILYWFAVLFLLVFCGLMWWAPMRRNIDCEINHTDKWGHNTYNCVLYSKSVLRSLEDIELPSIISAFIASRYDSESQKKLYQVRFRNSNNVDIAYSNTWTNIYGPLDKHINTLNKMFQQGKNFHYDFGVSFFLILGLIITFVFPLFLLRRCQKISNDYIFEEFARGKYQAVLEGKGLGKLHYEEAHALVLKIIGEERLQKIKEEFAQKMKGQGISDKYKMRDNGDTIYNFSKKQYNGPEQRSAGEEIASNLQDDDLTDMQKEFYDKGNN